MWKSNGCTLTPTAAARERARNHAKTRSSVARLLRPAESRKLPPARVPSRRHENKKKKIKTTNTAHTASASPRIASVVSSRARALARARARRTHANTSSRTPRQVTLHEGCFPCATRIRANRSVGRQSLVSSSRARIDASASSRRRHRGFPRERSNLSHPSSVVVRRRARAPVPPSPTRMSLNVGICCPCGGADMSSSSSSVGASVPSARARAVERVGRRCALDYWGILGSQYTVYT